MSNAEYLRETAALMRERAEAATPGPWERGNRFHIQGADKCRCDPGRGPLVWTGRRDINGKQMLTHVHRSDEPWWEHGIYSADTSGGNIQQVVIDTDEYGYMEDADAKHIAAADPSFVLAVADWLEVVADYGEYGKPRPGRGSRNWNKALTAARAYRSEDRPRTTTDRR